MKIEQLPKKKESFFASQNNLLYKEISVRDNKELDEILHMFTNEILKNKEDNKGIKKGPPQKTIEEEEPKADCCCIS